MASRLLNFFFKLKKFDFNLFFKFLFIVLKKEYSKYPKYVSSFESNFAKQFGAKYCLTFSSGTASFYASLLALNLKKDSKVLISSLTFPTVIETLKKFEFNIHYFSIDRNFKIIPPKTDDQKFDLLVMTYPFGFHINFEIIKSYLNKGSKTILDASHSQGMKIDNSNHVKFFDISFLSLQGNKSISGGEGGAILTDDENIYSKMINNHHPGHRLNKNLSVAGGITDLKLRMHPIAAVIGANDLKSFDVRNESLKEKVKNIYGYLDELNIKHPFNKNSIISGFHYGLPFFLLKEIKSDIIKKYNWYDNLDKFNLTSISKENNEIFFQNIYFLDLEWIKENKISIIKKKIFKIFNDVS
tara:strand:+ start:658 stop:1725 length:1068 start_codon:yes stop_codon:yes gene_type:complete